MISPPMASARRRESADFPAAVGPTTAIVSRGLRSAGRPSASAEVAGRGRNPGLVVRHGVGGHGVSLAAAGMARHGVAGRTRSWGDHGVRGQARRRPATGPTGRPGAPACPPGTAGQPRPLARPAHWLPQPRASRGAGARDRRPAAEPDPADDLLLPGELLARRGGLLDRAGVGGRGSAPRAWPRRSGRRTRPRAWPWTGTSRSTTTRTVSRDVRAVRRWGARSACRAGRPAAASSGARSAELGAAWRAAQASPPRVRRTCSGAPSASR